MDAFPKTRPQLKAIKYANGDEVLDTPIKKDAAGIQRYVALALQRLRAVAAAGSHGRHHRGERFRSAGKHTYPTPNDDAVFFCRSDFHPFVYDAATNTTFHVAPASSDPTDKRTRVIAVHPPPSDHPVAKQHRAAESKDQDADPRRE